MATAPSVPDRSLGGESGLAFENAAYRKVGWRLIPLLLLCYIVAYLDRVNIGFAKLQMQPDLHFSETVFGFGAGIFFIGYFLFEVPSNVILHKVGARVWIARIMVTWGVISACMMFVTTPEMFYVMRFLLGVAEAGFFPGIILYLTYWYPSERRGRVTAQFMTAVALSGVIGGPLSGYILKNFGGVNGWAGWQWMFLIEGIPSVIVGILVLMVLDDRILHAKWLSDAEKAMLQRNIDAEEQHKEHAPVFSALGNPRVWVLSLIYFGIVIGLYGIGFWLPTLIKAMGVKDVLDISLLSAIPYAFAVVAMLLGARSADRSRARRMHVAIPAFLGAVGLILSVILKDNTMLAMAALTLATMGILTSLPLFWSMPTAFLAGTGAAAGIALINSIGNLAGFVGPFAIGWLKDLTESTNSGMYMLAVCLVLAGILTLTLPSRVVDR